MPQFGIGQPVSRFEDPRLLRGEGRYQDDVNLPREAYAVFVRSPHAHAVIRAIDTASAAALPGVLGVFTEEDLARDRLGTTRMRLQRKRPDGTPMFAPPHPGLARARVRQTGDPVAMVVASSLAEAKDAAEKVAVDYEPLPSVTDTAMTAEPGAPAVWEECPDNVSNLFEAGDRSAVEAAFARAQHIVRRRYKISRVYAQYMEPRGALGSYDPGEGRFTLYCDCQYPHRVRGVLANDVFKVPESKIRVISGDVGGGFGTKGWQYVEHRLVLWAARKLGRPVKWTAERSEGILADEHARDNLSEAELALDAEARFLALRVATIAGLGAYVSSERNLLATFANTGTLVGVYRIPAAYVRVLGVLSNRNPTAPYRGAGRPEAITVIERLIDDAARELRLDRIELRRRNLVPPSAMPYRNALGAAYDCGDFPAVFDKALALGDARGFPTRRRESEAQGRIRGLGIAFAIERAAAPGLEFAEIRFNPDGTATLFMGTKNQGQGHETTFKQILNERLGIDPAEVQYIDGDTDRVAFGLGSTGSRSTVMGGSALSIAAEKVVAKGKKIAAHLLETAPEDLEFADGRFTVSGTDRALSLKEVARAAFAARNLPQGLEGGLYETGTFRPQSDTFPNGCHLCEVEIDPETGGTQVLSYAVVDDVGTVVNPTTLKGQIHGGVAQGLGQALLEEVVYDPESGQLLSGSFMDYAMPRADNVPAMKVESHPVPTRLNPLGAKGAGEAGTVGSLPAVMNAIVDALASAGAPPIDMPATSEKIWRALEEAGRG
jgi:aerobic carbon-monoxide dehydrogenase large subunit